MKEVVDKRLMNPEGGLRICRASDNPAVQYYTYGEWELPGGAEATQWQAEVAVSIPPCVASQARRIYARFVLSRKASDHSNPGTPDDDFSKGSLYTLLAKIASSTKLYEDYNASI